MLKKCTSIYLMALLMSLMACEGSSDNESNSDNGSGPDTESNLGDESIVTSIVEPKFIFDSTEADERTVLIVDGSQSTTTAEAISSYKWEVVNGDEVIYSMTDVDNAFAQLSLGDVTQTQTMQVGLTVTDSNNNSGTVYQDITVNEIDEDLLPDAPGASGNSTLIGIDANSNNVRDDVEREIYNLYKELSYMDRSVFWMVAHHLEEAIAFGAGLSSVEPDSIVDDLSRGIDCLHQISPESAEMWYSQLKILAINTEDRFNAFEQFNLSRNGTIQNVLTATEKECTEFAQ